MNCSKCWHEIKKNEHYVELEDGSILDESCFFQKAITELKAKSKQEGHEEED